MRSDFSLKIIPLTLYYELTTCTSSVCVCVCAIIPCILDVRLVDVLAGVTQEEDHTGFLHLSSAVLASIFLARRIQLFLSLVDRKFEFKIDIYL